MPRAFGDEGDYKNVTRLTVSCNPPVFQDGITIGVLRDKSRRARSLLCDVTRQSLESSGLRGRDVHAGSGAGIQWRLMMPAIVTPRLLERNPGVIGLSSCSFDT